MRESRVEGVREKERGGESGERRKGRGSEGEEK